MIVSRACSPVKACSKIMIFICTQISSSSLPAHIHHNVILDPGLGIVVKPAVRVQRCQQGLGAPEHKFIFLINKDQGRLMSGFHPSTHCTKKGKYIHRALSGKSTGCSGPGVVWCIQACPGWGLPALQGVLRLGSE